MIDALRKEQEELHESLCRAEPFDSLELIESFEQRYHLLVDKLDQMNKLFFMTNAMTSMFPSKNANQRILFSPLVECSLNKISVLRRNITLSITPLYIAKGELLLANEQPEECVLAWEKVLQTDPENKPVLNKIAHILKQYDKTP